MGFFRVKNMFSTLSFVLIAGLVGFTACTTLVGNDNQKLWRQTNSVKWVSLMESEVAEELHESLTLKAFSWNNCGPKDPIDLTYLSVTPDPIKLPGYANLSFTANVTQTLTQPIAAAVEVQKRIFGHYYMRIPCEDNYGSCTYPDVCTIIANQTCPPPFIANGIPCKCPVNKGNYHLPSSQFYVDDGKIPKILTKGEYKVSVLFKSGNQQIGCYNVTATLD